MYSATGDGLRNLCKTAAIPGHHHVHDVPRLVHYRGAVCESLATQGCLSIRKPFHQPSSFAIPPIQLNPLYAWGRGSGTRASQ